jgi:NADPH:quinone reductase-like Zn-dependent oxidoreductase
LFQGKADYMRTEGFFLIKKGEAKTAFEIRSFEIEPCLDNEILIEAQSFGLNYADVMARKGLYREAPPIPCVLGYEVVGKIISVGSSISKKEVGKRVLAFCRFGGYAKHVKTTEYAYSDIGNMDAGEALCLATQWVTAQYMVERSANVQEGDHVLIHAAAGGVGTALIQLCKRKKAVVYAKIGNRNKEQIVKELGADFVINYRDEKYEQTIRKQLKTNRLDVSFNPVAGSTFKKDWKLLGSGGRAVLFGGSELSSARWGILSAFNFVRKMGRPLPISLMMRSKSIQGVNMLKLADNKPMVIQQCMKQVIELAQNNEIQPIVGKRFEENQFIEAHRFLESGTSHGKIVVHWSNNK